MRTPNLIAVSACLCLMASLSACGSTPEPPPPDLVETVRTVTVLPPEEPDEPCPVADSATLADLILHQAAALRCEAGERRERRAWREEAARAPRRED